MATVRPDTNKIVARMRGVKSEVRDELDSREARVQAVVDAHRFTGAVSRSLKVRTNRVDSTVSISDPVIVPINYGHVSRNGSWVEGIHAIEAAL